MWPLDPNPPRVQSDCDDDVGTATPGAAGPQLTADEPRGVDRANEPAPTPATEMSTSEIWVERFICGCPWPGL